MLKFYWECFLDYLCILPMPKEGTEEHLKEEVENLLIEVEEDVNKIIVDIRTIKEKLNKETTDDL